MSLNYLAPPEIWVKKSLAHQHKLTHTHTLIHTILIQRWIHTVDLWLWVWIFASEKCKKVILEL